MAKEVKKVKETEVKEDVKKIEGTKTVKDAKELSTKKSGTKLEATKEVERKGEPDIIKLGEPIPTAQDLRKEVSANAEPTNPSTVDYSTEVKVTETQYENPLTLQKRTQKELMDNMKKVTKQMADEEAEKEKESKE